MQTQKKPITQPEALLTGIHPQEVSLEDFQSLDNFQKKHADKFTKAQLNWLLRFRDRNGLAESGAVIMVARKFYLHESRFAAWFNSQKA
ncbi:hypothetical protein U2W12_00425 [Methylomicrobium sp. Wu6]|nr:hypothetical protein [Methylomicrobium sp. Wu6]